MLGVTRRGFVCIFFRYGGRKLWSGSDEASPAALIRAAFNFSNPRGEIKKADTPKGICFFGDPPGIRTPDPLLKRQLLCQLS